MRHLPRARAAALLTLFAFPLPPLAAQDRTPAEKRASAFRAPDGTIRVDGRLDEAAWEQAMPITDFVQKEPDEGAAPTEPMEVRFVYDDDALYVGARMSKRPGSVIQAPMGRREDNDQAEHILVSFDTFFDRRTAYVFGVTASGVRVDRYHARDDEGSFDETYDPVWQARTSTTDAGWTAELWIPFSQLRFNASPDMTWGLNVQRFTPTLDEQDYWVAIPRTVRAWSSRFGTLTGLMGVDPSRRIEVSPYLAGSSRIDTTADDRNPFDGNGNLSGRVGADIKAGLGSNLTLEATINPDFGQVEADPAEVNLTATETFFDEKRPFFIEGADLINLQSEENFFYTRRIGAPPPGPASGDFVDRPSRATILGAAKVTGRLASGTSIGLLAAVTQEETARTFDLTSSAIREARIAPRTLYAVSRVQQQFGASQSTTSAFVSLMHRDLASGDPLAALLVRSSLTAAGDAILRFRGGEYELTSLGGLTVMQGDAAAIARVQRNSVHYAQRPDREHARYDPTRTSYPGYWARSVFARTGGRHWIWSGTTEVQSPGLDTNELGRLRAADAIGVNADVRYRETVPGTVLRSYWVGVRQNNEWTFGHERLTKSATFYTSQTWRNFWTTQATITRNFGRFDWTLTRGGPLMTQPRAWNVNVQLRNRGGSQTSWNLDLTRNVNEDGGFNNRLIVRLGFRPGPRWQLSVNPTLQRQVESQQYVATLPGGGPATYGNRYVFGHVDRSTYSAQMRLGYTFKPDLNLDLYAEPFAASGHYTEIGALAVPGTRRRLPFGPSEVAALGERDFHIQSLRSNVVLRWEYRPGTLLYVVWQQDRSASVPGGQRIGAGDVFQSFRAPGVHSFVVKTSFWIPVG
jgi:hypothetical protein